MPGVRACAVHAHAMCMSHAGCLFVSVNAAPMGALEGELRDDAEPLHAEFGFARSPGISPVYREAPCFFLVARGRGVSLGRSVGRGRCACSAVFFKCRNISRKMQ